MFWFFRKRGEVENIKEETKHSFNAVKKEIENVSGWIKHLDDQDKIQTQEIEDIKDILSSIQENIEGIKNAFSFMEENQKDDFFNRLFKQPRGVFNKQTAVQGVQTPVQTAVQTARFDYFRGFSVMERAIVWVLLNTELKLSYDDIAAMLGKSRSTIRGQINSIKQKSEGMIEEQIETNGKKRVYIPEQIKEKLLKSVKVRVKTEKFKKKEVKNHQKAIEKVKRES